MTQNRTDELVQDTKFGFLDKTTPSNRAYNPVLLANRDGQTMLRAISHELKRSTSFQFSVAFITTSALALLKQDLLEFEGKGVIYTSTYLDFNDPQMFEELLELQNIEVRVLDDAIDAFHSKGYIFHQNEAFKTSTAIIGSSNLTRSALLSNEEWNLKFSAFSDGHIVEQLDNAVSRLREHSQPLTKDWIRDYENRRRPLAERPAPVTLENEAQITLPVGKIEPNTMQQEALEEIKKIQDLGEQRALVISATGTGKTILAALATRQTKPQRVLFLVHREQILNKAIEEFQKVLDTEDKDNFGKYVGRIRDKDKKYVFATVQTLSKEETLNEFSKDYFDLIIIDEVHRAGAETYLRIIDHFEPRFLLGLTATPERSDDTNIYELFNFNVPYEIRLNKALEAKMLVPFSYFGVSDYVDDNGNTVDDDVSDIGKLALDERVDYVIEMIEKYGHKRDVKGLVFCSRSEEARRISEKFNERIVNGHQLRTTVLTGDDSPQVRESTIQELEQGQLDYIFTVDIFNEGIDIPVINQVVMLRHTQSSIIFTQQLGRGLRKFENKTHLRVIDFIGNYKNNFLIPIALFGDKSLDKDTIRKRIDNALQTGTIAGVSSVSFEEIALERILNSLSRVNLTAMPRLKEVYRELEHRLGKTPMRLDFARFDTPDPTAFLTSGKDRPTYWHFLKKIKATEEEIDSAEQGYLTLFDREFLNGKRPHELLLMKELLRNRRMSVAEFQNLLNREGAASDEATVNSAVSLLSLDFFSNIDRYGGQPVASTDGETIIVAHDFYEHYTNNAYFKEHIDDSIEAGLYLNLHHFNRQGKMEIGKRYSRKDVCRMLNWPGNYESTMYGYKADITTGTCPIFITYHKDEEIDDAIKYQDHLDDESTLSWFTKHGRTKKSKVEQKIIAGEYTLDIFIKKDDSEGSDFFYLGTATPRDAIDTTIQDGDSEKPIVNMKLDFVQPLEPVLFDYLTSKYESAMVAS